MKTFPVRGKRNRLVVEAPLDATGCGVLCKLATPPIPQIPPLENLYIEFFPVVEDVFGTTYLSARAGTENDIGQVTAMSEEIISVVIRQRVGANNLFYVEVRVSQGDARTLHGTEYSLVEWGGDYNTLDYGQVSNLDFGTERFVIEKPLGTVLFQEGLAYPYRLVINPAGSVE